MRGEFVSARAGTGNGGRSWMELMSWMSLRSCSGICVGICVGICLRCMVLETGDLDVAAGAGAVTAAILMVVEVVKKVGGGEREKTEGVKHKVKRDGKARPVHQCTCLAVCSSLPADVFLSTLFLPNSL